MASTGPDLDDDNADLPAVVVRLAGRIGEPLIVIEAAVLTPDAAIEFAMAIFSAAAMACAQARLDVAGRC